MAHIILPQTKNIWEKKNGCRIFEEIDKRIPAMETLLKEELSLQRYSVTQVEREDDDDLYEHVSSDVFQFLRKYVIRFVSRMSTQA